MSAILNGVLHSVVDHDFNPPMVVLMASDPVYGSHVATFEYAGYGFTEPGATGALASAEEAGVVAEEVSRRWNSHRSLIAAITGLLDCTELNLDDLEGDTRYQIENARAVIGKDGVQ
jgi:hypothetical protein